MEKIPTHPTTRRAAIRAGGIGLLGLGMNHLAQLPAMGASEEVDAIVPKGSAKNVIYIFLSGGLAQHESFDMKPNAPSEIRGEFQEISTKTPGLRISEHLPMLARRSEMWSICRSLTHSNNEHSQGHHVMLTGRSDIPTGFNPSLPQDSDWPSIAAIANSKLTTSNNLPPAIVLPDKIVHRSGRTLPGQFAGQLKGDDPFFVEASKYDPVNYGAYPTHLFHHERGSEDGSDYLFDVPSFTLPEGVDPRRMEGRLGLLNNFDAQQAHLEQLLETRQHNRYQSMATDLLFEPATKTAFNVQGAAPKLREAYGENSFGWSLLMARQLVSAGVKLVQVNLGNNECWDTHQSAFPNLRNFLLPPMDRAVSALLDDLKDRGMLDDTLIVMASEFGRTPKISTLGGGTNGPRLPGRDHWGSVQTAFFAGGGVQGGRVIGSSDKIGGYPASDPQKPEDLAATIYDALGLPNSMKWYDETDRPHFLYHGKPMAGLFS
ncbi:MAG: hypothetical protein ACI8UO_006103 [Verrucomicrobiales bacterium]|jgi:hypothetical protein